MYMIVPITKVDETNNFYWFQKKGHLYPYNTTHEGLEVLFTSLVWQFIFKDIQKAT